MKFIIASAILFVSLFFSLTSEAALKCELSETVGDMDTNAEFSLSPNAEGKASVKFSELANVKTQSEFIVENGTGTLRVFYPESARTFTHTSKISKGSRSRFMVYMPSATPGTVDLSCDDEEETPLVPRSRLDCFLMEKSEGQTLTTPFKAPIARGGHDTYELPPAPLTKSTGWVLGYPPLLVLFMMNEAKDASITSMGLLSGRVNLSWFPKAENVEVSLSCEGEGIPLGGW